MFSCTNYDDSFNKQLVKKLKFNFVKVKNVILGLIYFAIFQIYNGKFAIFAVHTSPYFSIVFGFFMLIQ